MHIMRKYILTLLLLLSPVFAQSIKANYDVSFGIFGKIGKAEITYTRDNDDYLIHAHAWTTGMSALLSRHREEEYISQGKIINNVLRPDVFVKFRKSDRLIRTSLYTFDHENKKNLNISQKRKIYAQPSLT